MAEENGSADTVEINMGGETEGVDAAEFILINEARKITERLDFARRAGMQYDGDRDVYEELGYPRGEIDFEDYVSRYERQHIAGKIVDLPAQDTWRNHPEITVDEDEEMSQEFSDQWDAVVETTNLWHNNSRADKLSGIGRYSVLFLGLSDAESIDELAESPMNEDLVQRFNEEDEPQPGMIFNESDIDLMFVSPYSEGDAEIVDQFEDPTSPRFGKPKTYRIDMSGEMELSEDVELEEVDVHADRVIHVAQDALFDEVRGRPQLKRIYNLLMDLEKIIGPWAESYWREVSPDWAFTIDEDAKFDNSGDVDDFEDEIQKFIHNIQNYYVQKGVTPERITPDIQDFSDGIESLFKLISGETDIPLRKLFGTERGDLASTQDERHWAQHIDDRRTWFAEPIIIRPEINRLVKLGILPAVDWGTEWPDLFTLTEKEKSEIRLDKSKAAANYDKAAQSGLTITEAEARAAQKLRPEPSDTDEMEEFRRQEDQEMSDFL